MGAAYFYLQVCPSWTALLHGWTTFSRLEMNHVMWETRWVACLLRRNCSLKAAAASSMTALLCSIIVSKHAKSQIGNHTRLAFWVALLGLARSEEHTSELQSLMRISYAVYCLKTKNHN